MASIQRSGPAAHAVRIDMVSVLLLALVALAPAIMALASWHAEARDYGSAREWITFLAVPITAIQCTVIALAFRAGFEPVRMLAGAPRWIQGALLVAASVAFGTAYFVAVEPHLAIYRTATNGIHLVFGLAAAHLIGAHWAQASRWLWPAIVAGTCAYLLLVAVFVASIPDPHAFDWEYFGLGVTNIRQTGFHSAIGAAAALGLAAFARGRAWALWVAAASLLVALSFWSGTRSAPVALAAAFGAGYALLPDMRTRRAVVAFIASFLGGAILSLVHMPPSPLYGLVRMLLSLGLETPDEISSGRIEMWMGTLRVLPDHPLFGVGESQFRWVVPESLGTFSHPHNFVLQLLLQWGTIGTVCVLAAGAALWMGFHRRAARMLPTAAPAYLVANAMLVFSLYEGSFYHGYPIMMTAIALAFVLARPPAFRDRGEP